MGRDQHRDLQTKSGPTPAFLAPELEWFQENMQEWYGVMCENSDIQISVSL